MEDFVRELFSKTEANEKGLAESLEVLETKVLAQRMCPCQLLSVHVLFLLPIPFKYLFLLLVLYSVLIVYSFVIPR